MASSLQSPAKEINVEFLVFVQRYATDLLKWDILTFFGHYPDFSGTISQIARRVGRNSAAVRPEVGDLVLLGILEQTDTPQGKSLYQLTQQADLRLMTLKLADTQLSNLSG